MRELTDVPLAGRTTLRLGGAARRLVEAETEAELVDLVRAADAAGDRLLLLGGGSNLVVADTGFDGLVVQVATRGTRQEEVGGRVRLTAAAGEPWDALVADAVADGLAGVEALSGIPGLVGATPIQNVGAYGQEVAQTVVSVRVLDRRSGEVRELSPPECAFTYRHSVFKGNHDHVVLAVTFALEPSGEGAPVRYAELARRLGVAVGERAPLPDVRAAVLDLRRGKGMVLDPDDHDTWSAGSFFTNPVLPAEVADRLLPADAPRWPELDGRVKTSAAWLIERSGFSKGYGEGPARVSAKHTLALTNRGGARTDDLLALAREIRAGVRARFGIELVNEPVLVGCSL
ncbi:MAG TPA: UDP-N-acetylmuramate dehydrogenase [Actinomycetes bacterium]